jgi:hypothetical protein
MRVVLAIGVALSLATVIVGCSGGSDVPELHTPPAGMGPKNGGTAQVPNIAHKKADHS